jgi:hypothetical protein
MYSRVLHSGTGELEYNTESREMDNLIGLNLIEKQTKSWKILSQSLLKCARRKGLV